VTPAAAPWYLPQHDEVALFEAAWRARQPVLLKGPTGCGKTRFVEHMAWRIGSERPAMPPLTTVACHDDLSAADLVGRWLLDGERTVWRDGPLTRAARGGGLCYLDEIVEARKDTTVVLHALTDHRRLLPIDKTGELLVAHADFLLVVSYNPGHAQALKELKPSTRQRFVCLEFGYPGITAEAEIVAHEGGVDATLAERLATIASHVRRIDEPGLELGVGTRLLVYAAQLVAQGVAPRRACEVALVATLSDDAQVQQAIADVVDLVLPR